MTYAQDELHRALLHVRGGLDHIEELLLDGRGLPGINLDAALSKVDKAKLTTKLLHEMCTVQP